MKPLMLLPLLGCLVTLASCVDNVRWCVTSQKEKLKCDALAAAAPVFSCERRGGTQECLTAIQAGEADAITLDGGDIYTAGSDEYKLHPIIAEQYGTAQESCYYAVAVAKKGSGFKLSDLGGKKTCHTGVGKSAGWNIPIGTLLSKNYINWKGSDDKNLEEVVSEYFHSSCAPGATYQKLCELCKGDCSKTDDNPYYNYHGAFQCLKDGQGDVAFVKHLTVPENERDGYELLCPDNSRKPINQFESCYLAKVPAHAVVTRSNNQELADLIWRSLNSVQNFNIFSSTAYGGKNLMFKDSTSGLKQLPAAIDHTMYLGPRYLASVKAVRKVNIQAAPSDALRWCAVGHSESVKCDQWSEANLVKDNTQLDCIKGNSFDDCLKKIMHKEADAVTVDGGEVYTAGKCGLVPAMVEQYDEGQCSATGAVGSFYFAVAVIKKGSGVTWANMKEKKSCHTGMGRNAGWNIPMGLLYNQHKTCNFSTYFSRGCAPGADPDSPLCGQCVGNTNSMFKCKPSNDERYYGYAGAFRCLAEGAGDVAFIKHTIVKENTDGQGPEWAKNLLSKDYELISPSSGPVPVTDFLTCHLAKVTAHATVTRPEIRNKVASFLKDQQGKFGNDASEESFKMFGSKIGVNLLFKSSTKCLQEVPADQDYQQFLGQDYMQVMSSLRICKESVSELEQLCTYNLCQTN